MKRKIVNVFAISEETAKKKIVEAGLLSKVAGAFKGKNKPAQAPAEEDDGDVHGLKADGESSVQQVINRIFSVPSDSKRCVLFLNSADLKSRYLVKGGNEQVAKNVDDKDLQNSLKVDSKHPNATTNRPDYIERKFLTVYTPEFDLDAVMGPEAAFAPYAVLLNVKKPILNAFIEAKTVEEKRAALAKCLDHKFYVGVLNTEAIKKADVGNLTNQDEREDKFDIAKFIYAYPVRAVLDAAREEQAASFEGRQSEGDTELIQKIVKKAVNFVFKSATNGKLKISKAKFEKELLDILEKDPAFDGQEHLRGAVLDEFLNDKHLLKGNFGSILSFLSASTFGDEAPTSTSQTTGAEGITGKDIEDLTPDEIAHKLASKYRRGNPELQNALKKWGLV